jgi:hypothetical protein
MATKFVAVTVAQSPPYPLAPQQATVPSDFSAAKAYWELAIVVTPLVSSSACAVVGVPPLLDKPQVTTLPSVSTAAKACDVP